MSVVLATQLASDDHNQPVASFSFPIIEEEDLYTQPIASFSSPFLVEEDLEKENYL